MHCWSPRPPSCASSSAACRRPPRPAAQRRLLRDAVRRLADPGVLGQDRPPPPQPRRRPPSQRRAVPGRPGPAALASAHQGLHGTAAQGGQVQKGDHPLPQTLRRPGGVRSTQPDKPRHPHPSRLTSIRASLIDEVVPHHVPALRSTISAPATSRRPTRTCPHGRSWRRPLPRSSSSGSRTPTPRPLAQRLREGRPRSAGTAVVAEQLSMLEAPALSVLFLLLGALGVLDKGLAVGLALWNGVAQLVGWVVGVA